MRYLITGGLGFLGVNLTKYLLDTDPGAEIVIVDPAWDRLSTLARFVEPERVSVGTWAELRVPDGMTFRRDGRIGATLSPGRVEVLLYRMRDLDPGRDITSGWLPDRIYHLASHASPAVYRENPIGTLHTGALDTIASLRLAEVTRHARYLLASTSEVYGDPAVSPQPETYRGRVSSIGPRSMYDESKRYAEALVAASVNFGLEGRIARIFNTYGPGMARDDGRLIPALLTACEQGRPLPVHEPGTQTRSLCYVDDTIRGLVALMESDHPDLVQRVSRQWRQPSPVNIGNPHEIPVMEIAEEVQEAWGIAPPIERIPNPCPDDPRTRRPDITRARELLEWEPQVPLAEGLRRTIADWIALEG